jgi:hypothetical protein
MLTLFDLIYDGGGSSLYQFFKMHLPELEQVAMEEVPREYYPDGHDVAYPLKMRMVTFKFPRANLRFMAERIEKMDRYEAVARMCAYYRQPHDRDSLEWQAPL